MLFEDAKTEKHRDDMRRISEKQSGANLAEVTRLWRHVADTAHAGMSTVLSHHRLSTESSFEIGAVTSRI